MLKISKNDICSTYYEYNNPGIGRQWKMCRLNRVVTRWQRPGPYRVRFDCYSPSSRFLEGRSVEGIAGSRLLPQTMETLTSLSLCDAFIRQTKRPSSRVKMAFHSVESLSSTGISHAWVARLSA